ncbi:uncharacterized protein LOC100373748 [Saccoglossus kowalevskii]|uniref:Uncharacterized protein LOC100373748 n=1 Tax=Saccoglossus kowalevskii TaxID=10224 RepID=A0ABM0H0U8_SACKO|nr:PREDICTED: uncharacterized protein LOC100373748 [Saccoglossus kowalevskii]
MVLSGRSSSWLRLLAISMVLIALVDVTLSARPGNLQWLYGQSGKKRSNENSVTSSEEDGLGLIQPPTEGNEIRITSFSDEAVGSLVKRLPPFWRQFVFQLVKLSMMYPASEDILMAQE